IRVEERGFVADARLVEESERVDARGGLIASEPPRVRRFGRGDRRARERGDEDRALGEEPHHRVPRSPIACDVVLTVTWTKGARARPATTTASACPRAANAIAQPMAESTWSSTKKSARARVACAPGAIPRRRLRNEFGSSKAT